MAEGRFREDLLCRVRVARLRLLPLRERREDIPVMVAWFLDQARACTGTAAREVARDAMQALLDYAWPGNIRELTSAIESAAISASGPVIRVDDFPAEIRRAAVPPAESPGSSAERRQLVDALTRTGGNRAAAARVLGIARSTFYRRLEIHGIDAE